MDGLSFRAGQNLLNTGQTTSSLNNKSLALDKGDKGPSFSETLKNSINDVNKMQLEADQKMQELATGKNTNIADVMMTTEKADIALRLMTQVRNKIIDAYQEIMKMQV